MREKLINSVKSIIVMAGFVAMIVAVMLTMAGPQFQRRDLSTLVAYSNSISAQTVSVTATAEPPGTEAALVSGTLSP